MSGFIIIIIALYLLTNFLKPVPLTYIYHIELSSTLNVSFTHCLLHCKHTYKHTYDTDCKRLLNSVYLLGSPAARRVAKVRRDECRYKLFTFSHGSVDERLSVLAHFKLNHDELSLLQIFLPWSWSTGNPQPLLSTHPDVFTDLAYFPYNKYIFDRALLTDEERQASKCQCYHYTSSKSELPPSTTFDWPCGCTNPYSSVNTRLVTAVDIKILWDEQPGMSYIVAPHDSGSEEVVVRFSVPSRRTVFPAKKTKKRRNPFGPSLSLTDRKHYRKGKSSSKT